MTPAPASCATSMPDTTGRRRSPASAACRCRCWQSDVMTATLITNIGELTTNVARDGDALGTLRDAAVLLEGDRVAWAGAASAAPHAEGLRTVDAGGRAVLPGFVDSHTHLVFGGDRADEFEARMTGV